MGITKDQLFFDPANPTDGDSSASYVRGADGTVIGNTGDALKVTGSFNVDGSTVALDAASLAALENITIDNASIEISNDAGNPIPVTGSFSVDGSTVALDAATLAALESITVSGSVELGATTLAALETITVTATDLDTRDLTFATDAVDVSGSTVALDATSLSALENITVSVDNVDFDIRDLAFATDSVDVSGSSVSLDAATLAALESVTVSGTVELGATSLAALEEVTINDGGASITVDAVDLDIRDLTHATDSMKIGDGTDFLEVNSDGSINVSPQIANGINNTPFVANNTASPILTTQLVGRRIILIQNLGNKDVYIGGAGVTTGNGIVVPAGSSAEFPWGETIVPYAVTASSTANLRILETSYV